MGGVGERQQVPEDGEESPISGHDMAVCYNEYMAAVTSGTSVFVYLHAHTHIHTKKYNLL